MWALCVLRTEGVEVITSKLKEACAIYTMLLELGGWYFLIPAVSVQYSQPHLRIG